MSEHGLLLHQWVQKAVSDYITITEEQMALYIRPPPRFVPARLWFWLCSKVFVRTIERKP